MKCRHCGEEVGLGRIGLLTPDVTNPPHDVEEWFCGKDHLFLWLAQETVDWAWYWRTKVAKLERGGA